MHLRYPKTHQEMKANLEEYGRARRNFKNLPCSWDDASVLFQKSWKKFRDNQYKVINKFEVKKKDSLKYGRHMSRRDHFHKEHIRCYLQSKRCNFCIKNDIWDDILIYEIRSEKQKISKSIMERIKNYLF